MKTNVLLTAAIIFAGSNYAAQADPKAEVQSAIKKLAEKGNYSWTSTSKRPETTATPDAANNRWRSGPTNGKTAEGMVHLASTRGERTSESLIKGDKAAVKRDEGWTVIGERPSGDTPNAGQPGQRRGRGGSGRGLTNYKAPAVQAEELLAKVGELKKDGDVYVGQLTEEGAKSLVSFGGGRPRGGADGADAPERPQPTGVKVSAKFWVKDGVLAKYETDVAAKITFNGNERDMSRISTVEIKDVGSTKIDVPEDTKKQLSAPPKPAAEEKPAAETKPAAE